MWCKLVLVFVGIITSGATLAYDELAHGLTGIFIYENASRTASFAYKNGQLEVGPILPNNPLGDQKIGFIEFLGSNAYDCSDENYRCVAADQNVLAVPRKQLSPGMSYIMSGTVFTVEDCLRGFEKKCQVALVKGDCQYVRLAENLRECAPYPGGRGKSSQPGAVHYFIYNEDYGITSLGIVDEELKLKTEMRVVATTYILQGNVGLLKAH